MERKTDTAYSRTIGDKVSQRTVLPLMGLGVLLLLIGYGLWENGGWLMRLDRTILDQFHMIGHKVPEREDVVILGIDDASQKLDGVWPEEIEESEALMAMQNWPWSRVVWSELIERLMGAGAKTVMLDLTFKGRSANPEEDERLRAVLEKYRGRVILGMNFEGSSSGRTGGAMVRLVKPVETVVGPLEDRLCRLGHLNFWAENAVVREAVLLTNTKEALLRDYLGVLWDQNAQHAKEAQTELDEALKKGEAVEVDELVPSVTLVAAELKDAEKAKESARQRVRRMRFGHVMAYPPISLHEIFVPGLWEANFENGAFFKDKVVFVGATGTDMQDFHVTPVGRMAGVQLHAHALTAILSGAWVKEVPAWWSWVAVTIGALLAWLVVSWVIQPVLALLLLLVLSALSVAGAYHGFETWNLELSPMPMVLGILGCGLAGWSGNFLSNLREKQKLRRFLARYTAPELVGEMMSDRVGLFTTLGGVERTVTVLFSDVRGFTSMAEGMSPQEVVGQLNEYLSRMVEQVFHHKGLVDKFIGDAVMALWGSTRAEQNEAYCKDDALLSVKAALGMRKALLALNEERRSRGLGELRIGMGIHQGRMVVGNIGSAAPYEKMDLTVIGDSVNLASRLEGATKEYGLDLVVSGDVWAHVEEWVVGRPVDLVRVKGKLKPVEIHTVLDEKGSQTVPLQGLEAYKKGVEEYRRGDFTNALSLFHKARKEWLDDELTNVYVQRCERLLQKPPENWDGVFVMTKK